MAIPPNDKNPEKHFKKISELNKQFNFQELVLECPMITYKQLNTRCYICQNWQCYFRK